MLACLYRHPIKCRLPDIGLKGDGNAILTGTLTQNSDARLKTNIHPLGNVLSRLTSLNGYSYKWKNEQLDQSTQIGLLAQEVENNFPELVKENDKGVKSVNYSGLIPVLIESIKEQQKMINQQNEMILELKKKVERLELRPH